MPRLQPPRLSAKVTRAFTLIELMITVAVLGIIAAIATPSFTAIIEQNRTSKAANEFVGQLNLVRAEALRRGQAVSLCPADAELSKCDGTEWSRYVALEGEGDEEGGTVILARQLPSGVTLSGLGSKLKINRSGTLADSGISVTVSPKSGVDSRKQCITIIGSGSASVKGGKC